MLTKGHFLIIHIRIKRFRLYLPLPMCVLQELLWQIVELTDLVGIFGNKKLREMKKEMPTILVALDSIGVGGQYDLLEIEADSRDGDKVRIVIKVR